jgi:hypothetical protein
MVLPVVDTLVFDRKPPAVLSNAAIWLPPGDPAAQLQEDEPTVGIARIGCGQAKDPSKKFAACTIWIVWDVAPELPIRQ